MESREIFNHLGESLGFLELPEGASEEVWAEELAKYAQQHAPEFKSITPRQIRLVLFSMGITSQMVINAIEAAIPSPDKELALIEWEYAIGFDRHAPFVSGVGALLGLSEDQINLLWIQAAQV